MNQAYNEGEDMTDEELECALNRAGKQFFLNNIEEILHWKGSNKELAIKIHKSWNPKITLNSTKTRISTIRRIIKNRKIKESLEKIKNSQKVNKQCLEASNIASQLLKNIKQLLLKFYFKEDNNQH